jgi:hypothetical protein
MPCAHGSPPKRVWWVIPAVGGPPFTGPSCCRTGRGGGGGVSGASLGRLGVACDDQVRVVPRGKGAVAALQRRRGGRGGRDEPWTALGGTCGKGSPPPEAGSPGEAGSPTGPRTTGPPADGVRAPPPPLTLEVLMVKNQSAQGRGAGGGCAWSRRPMPGWPRPMPGGGDMAPHAHAPCWHRTGTAAPGPPRTSLRHSPETGTPGDQRKARRSGALAARACAPARSTATHSASARPRRASAAISLAAQGINPGRVLRQNHPRAPYPNSLPDSWVGPYASPCAHSHACHGVATDTSTGHAGAGPEGCQAGAAGRPTGGRGWPAVQTMAPKVYQDSGPGHVVGVGAKLMSQLQH